MEPYTGIFIIVSAEFWESFWIFELIFAVSGLAKIEGEVIEVDEHPDEQTAITTKYELTGIVVHSGQASGGHYFSYILHKWAKRRFFLHTENSINHLSLYNS